MDKRSGNGAVEGNGRNTADDHQNPALEADRIAVNGFLLNLIGSRRDRVAYALYPHLDPDEAIEALLRNLRGKGGRKVGIHELDTILTVLGEEDEEKYFRFALKRRKIVPPPVFERYDELSRLRSRIEEALQVRERGRQDSEEADRLLRELLVEIQAKESLR